MAHGIYPTALREFLAAGGSPTEMDRWRLLVDDALRVLGTGSAHRRAWAEAQRNEAADIVSDAGVTLTTVDGPMRLGRPQAVQNSMAAEMCDDPELAERFIDGLPEDDRARAWRRLDVLRRPHPLTVAAGGDHEWSCDNCGTVHDLGDRTPRVLVGEREGGIALDFEISYCPSCLRNMVTIADAAPV